MSAFSDAGYCIKNVITYTKRVWYGYLEVLHLNTTLMIIIYVNDTFHKLTLPHCQIFHSLDICAHITG